MFKAVIKNNMSENNVNLIEPFDIDDGTLKGIAPEYAFALGAEWEIFRQRINSGNPFTTFCLPENATRFVKMAERHRRFVEDRPNVTPGWSQIFVGDYLV
jgi:hypothetical protein